MAPRPTILVIPVLAALVASAGAQTGARETPTLALDTPMPAPAWAFAERVLLEANADGAAAYAEQFLDEAGHLRTPERWGVSDGPDDAMETIRLWPLAYALGGPSSILAAWERAWEGHIDQYSNAKIPTLELARDGIYHKEFITSFDWEHTAEALGGFYFYGLGRPDGRRYVDRMRRFAGFYMNEDPDAPNYDPEHRLNPEPVQWESRAEADAGHSRRLGWRGRPGGQPGEADALSAR